MLNSKSFLAADFGAGTLKLAEFAANEAGGLSLVRFGVKTLGAEGAQESNREAIIVKALQELLVEKGFASKNINVCAPSFHVFSKFVKLPPVDAAKVAQIVEYEARQNVPFPLEEVVWDYQILGTAAATGELEVLLVAIKTDIVEGLFRVAEGTGLRIQLVDVAPAGLCNAFRYNYADMEGEGCTMLLDIGAKTSNLLFFEKGKVYSRSINIGANAITQDFAAEGKLKFADAEAAKIEKGFVSLGGAYEEPDDPQAAAISKIARQVMTRLHIQVNQTIQFYRGQQGGSAPLRLYLAGGASVMTYAAQFFAEKLNVPVDYFNPFRNVQIDPGLNVEDLAPVAHSFGEVVGLGLRSLARCPVELNLMPKSSIQRQEFQQKKPFFIAAAFSLAAVVFAIWFFEQRVVSIKRDALDSLKTKVQPMLQKESEMAEAQRAVENAKSETEKVVALIEDRFFWPQILMEFRRVLMQAEDKTKQKLNTDVGLWMESFLPQAPALAAYTPPAAAPAPMGDVMPAEAPIVDSRYSMDPRYSGMGASGGVPTTGQVASGSEVSTINIICRGLDLERTSPAANNELVFNLKTEITGSSFFVPEATVIEPINKDETGTTFTLSLIVKLKRPLKFSYPMD